MPKEITYDNFTEIVKPGQKWRIGNRYNKLIYIRFVDGDGWVMFRHWRRARWVYEVESIGFFMARLESDSTEMVSDGTE